jgi:uncharacterized protein with von Willebrand factor type A (vWA) domain
MSADELKAQVDGIVTRISTAQFYLQKVRGEFDEITQELLALDLGGSNSHHVTSANRLWPTVMQEFDIVPMDLSLIHSEMIQYRRSL